jgi:hypothetical protein
MKKFCSSLRWFIPSVCLIVVSLLFLGWGTVGHSIVNDFCVIHLPAALKGFVDNRSIIKANASAADNRKGNDSNLPYIFKETPRHFIDVDEVSIFPGFATQTIPKDISVIIAQVNGDSSKLFATSNSTGVLPWAIIWTLDSLSAQMKRRDWSKVWFTAADLGHYVGDLHQPLHATQYYGVSETTAKPGFSGSGGIHSRYESGMLSSSYPYASSIIISPASVQYIDKPIDYIFDRVYETNGLVDSIYNSDKVARLASGGSFNATYYAKLWEMTGQMTQIQFQRATQVWANLIYTIWVNAGSPSTFVEEPNNQISEFRLEQNYPNPFNPNTIIEYDIPYVGTQYIVSLRVYDILGKEIAVLVNEQQQAGRHQITFNASNLASGIYIYRIDAVSDADNSRKFVEARKMILLR